MNLKQFEAKKKTIYKKHNVLKTDLSHEVFLNTPFGRFYVKAEYIPKIKIASIHTLLRSDKLKEFKDLTGYNINTYNGKFNNYSEDPEFILNELDEFLENLNYLNESATNSI